MSYDTLKPKQTDNSGGGRGAERPNPPSGQGARPPLSPPSGAPKQIRTRGAGPTPAPTAAGKDSKSGYEDKIHPGQPSQPNAVPKAAGRFSAKRSGRLTPAEKLERGMYKGGKVVPEGASGNQSARIRGDMPTAQELNRNEGSNVIELEDETEENMIEEHDAQKGADFDPLGDVPEPEPGSAELVEEEKALAARRPAQANPVEQRRPWAESTAQAAPLPTRSGADAYLQQRCRITLEMDSGSMTVPAVNVIASKYGLTILLPSGDNDATFIPKPGSEITVVKGDESWDCYFPGVSFEIPELDITGLSFVRKDEA